MSVNPRWLTHSRGLSPYKEDLGLRSYISSLRVTPLPFGLREHQQ